MIRIVLEIAKLGFTLAFYYFSYLFLVELTEGMTDFETAIIFMLAIIIILVLELSGILNKSRKE